LPAAPRSVLLQPGRVCRRRFAQTREGADHDELEAPGDRRSAAEHGRERRYAAESADIPTAWHGRSGGAGAGAGWSVARAAGPLTGEDALARLLDGNRRFAAGLAQHPNQSLDQRTAVAAGQQPFAFVLGCFDSRVSHELVFDQGLGDLFSSRTAGNLLDDAILGGIEFGVEEFHLPLVLILGHQRCGAVSATVDALSAGTGAPGMIGRVVEAIRPAVELAQAQPGDAVDNAVRAQVQLGIARLQTSPVIVDAIEHRNLKVVGGYYSLDTGTVAIIA
jgi:carbonic anhydrase